MLVYFNNDMQSLPLVQEHAGLVVDYRDIPTRLAEMASYVGSSVTQAELTEIAAKPLTKKLDPLESYVDPLEPLIAFSDVLDDAFWSPATGKTDVRKVFVWTESGNALIDTPGFPEFLARYGLDASRRPDGSVEWAPGKPVLLL